MGIITRTIPYIQIILAVVLIALVLLQTSDADLGGTFGGSDTMNASAHTRRGFERVTFNFTILIGILFAASAFFVLILR